MKHKKLFPYYGGKFYLLNDIFKIIAPIQNEIITFVDVFGGSGTVLLNIPLDWKCNKIFNDIDLRIFKVMMALKNDPDSLKKEMDKTIRSREYFNLIKNKDAKEMTPFEYLYLIANSFGGITTYASFGVGRTSYRNNYFNTFENAFKNAEYLKYWILENLDFSELIKKYDSEKTFFYLDPPYLTAGRKYANYFTETNFKELNDLCKGMKGKYLLNESETDFSFIESLWGTPAYVKEYNNMVTMVATKRSKRKEGFWTNFKEKGLLTW